MKSIAAWITVTIVTVILAAPAHADFQAWLKELRAEANGKGISEATLDAALHTSARARPPRRPRRHNAITVRQVREPIDPP